MSLQELLQHRRDAIVERWFDEVLAAYPTEGGAFFKRQKDQFANPVGHSGREGTGGLFDALLSGADAEATQRLLADMLRIRAIQELPPSTAVGFVLGLKGAVRAEVTEAQQDLALALELADFEERIDALALLAFDVYAGFREQLAQIHVYELQRKVSWIIDRLNGSGEELADPPGPDGSTANEAAAQQERAP